MIPPPGRLIDVGGHRLHLHCRGGGRPAVIFDAALGASSLSWSLVQPEVARVTAACTYDRAGFGWSDAGPLPRTAGRIADELHTLLAAAGVGPPYVLVGHSFGGLVMQLFAARHRHHVVGLVLIEPPMPEEWIAPSADRLALLARGRRLCAIGDRAARLRIAGVVNWLVGAGALAPARAIVRLISGGSLRRADEGILAPIWKLPRDARGVLGQMWTQPKFFEALGSQIAHVPASAAAAGREPIPRLETLPLRVISSQTAAPSRLDADAALAARSQLGRHIQVENSGHWIPLDAPQAVVAAIVDLVQPLLLPSPGPGS